MQLADSQERHAALDDKVIEAERALNQAREQQRGLERQAQEATFALRSLRAGRSDGFIIEAQHGGNGAIEGRSPGG